MTYTYKFNHDEENIAIAIGLTEDTVSEMFKDEKYPQHADMLLLNRIAHDPSPIMLTLSLFIDSPVFGITVSKVFEQLINSTTQEQRNKAVELYKQAMEA